MMPGPLMAREQTGRPVSHPVTPRLVRAKSDKAASAASCVIQCIAGTVAAAIVAYGFNFLLNTTVPVEDVSAAAEYATVVGARFQTQRELLTFGLTADPRKKGVEYSVLNGPPWIGGWEVLSEGRLRAGSIVQVVNVLKWAFPFARVNYVVRTLDQPPDAVPIKIGLTGSANDPNLGLDRALFARVE